MAERPSNPGLKRVVSVSLGSSHRDHAVEVEVLGQRVRIERIGTDGDKRRAVELIRQLDGQVDAFGMGGTDLYVWAGRKRLVIRDALPLLRAARRTPIVDGSGLKHTLERRVVYWLDRSGVLPLRGRPVLLVSAVDRIGMARALVEVGARVTFGDLGFLLGIPVPLRSLRALELAGRLIGPVAVQLPIEWLYPVGPRQRENRPRLASWFAAHPVIAGDFHLIRRYMPPRLDGKAILTNTVTREDVEELRRRGVHLLVTTTPELGGRSFGTNVMEALLVALSGRRPEELTPEDYEEWLDRLQLKPRVEVLAGGDPGRPAGASRAEAAGTAPAGSAGASQAARGT